MNRTGATSVITTVLAFAATCGAECVFRTEDVTRPHRSWMVMLLTSFTRNWFAFFYFVSFVVGYTVFNYVVLRRTSERSEVTTVLVLIAIEVAFWFMVSPD
jgi:fructose-specific phosphotransferase system IIC component